MPRTRYTRLTHDCEGMQIDRQVRDIARLVWRLRHMPVEETPELSATDESKARRRTRFERNWRTKSNRP